MYLTFSANEDGQVGVTIEKASVYENRGCGYKDHDCPNEKWLRIQIGINILGIRMRMDQLNQLYSKLGALIQDVDSEAKLKESIEKRGFRYDPDPEA